MKNVNDRFPMNGEYVELEPLMALGRQLQARAVFEMCANLVKLMRISKNDTLRGSLPKTSGWANPK